MTQLRITDAVQAGPADGHCAGSYAGGREGTRSAPGAPAGTAG